MILNRIISLRKKKRWSLQYTADRLGIAKSTYAGYESGYRRPSLESIKSMADLFDTSIDYILGRVEHSTFLPKEISTESVQFMELTDPLNLELAVDGISLSEEEMIQFIAFIRAKRELERNCYKQYVTRDSLG
ncbi:MULTISPECIES: helix-turn-helix domain-containing protein [unclassified Peribacillus]|uniref:helix-turn-helix domain-containing protein n=1 Tax=unclassified Peribacillus TaxID=2675266 RepID=UPI0019148EB4|nr:MULTISPECIES: helix-turn-helix transcriptional regulator [unclassified Peribacillus]MBK5443389.1 helix-turn-helix transcriptional regulator [Peribacillus sp. TH24]MBK5461879.1 helix-turn-helix transcriptional regulator [Peribacillus sp. TH27]MBK5484785.1 helix-turn-helix transcriptional regulator [Peribacillus sp. TH16]MBK5500032.1 helix-turn-helix transcriptional regulator [Peribacillus sp. TH14]WMX54924.1 helix-turn-helix transcriptional regulator [Peribacillus sp. R9-11]